VSDVGDFGNGSVTPTTGVVTLHYFRASGGRCGGDVMIYDPRLPQNVCWRAAALRWQEWLRTRGGRDDEDPSCFLLVITSSVHRLLTRESAERLVADESVAARATERR
jgi:hypothetical protein